MTFVVTLLRMLALDVALVNNHKIEVVDSFCYLGGMICASSALLFICFLFITIIRFRTV